MLNIPEGHQAVMPYLMLKNANEFIEFTQKVFQAKLTHKSLREDQKTIRHAQIQISGSTLMFSESTQEWGIHTAHFFVYVENADETFQSALQNGASELRPLNDEDYGRSGGVTDPFGNVWWITSVN